MNQPFNYTSTARNFSFRHPVLSAILVQVTFWCISHSILGVILFLNAKAIADTSVNNAGSILPIILSSIIMGLFYGTVLGLSDYYFFRLWSKGKSLGKLILLKALWYFTIMMLIFAFIRFVLWERILLPTFYIDNLNELNPQSWNAYFYMVCVFTLFMSVFVSFYIQINKKFGPGVLLPLIMGKYVQPKIEERAFLFLDLKSSTTYAEELGHVRYSQLIRDCFLDINQISVLYEAEIYQYVGDEMVLCWLINKDTDLTRCIDFFFACQKNFSQRKEYYISKHGVFPEFKAGLHKGIVTGVEVGDVKRELAYHGDTLNVTARIQAKCNENDADIIISEVHSTIFKNNCNVHF